MSSPFNAYYYDNNGGTRAKANSHKSKLEVAKESIAALIDHLRKNDKLGIVLFDDDSYLAKPLNYIGSTDISALKAHIMRIVPQGATNMEKGLKLATSMFSENELKDKEYDNRIILLTDAQPNIGETSPNGLLQITLENSLIGLYTTFIGIGVDFNSELIEKITKIRGANYYSVHNSEEFKLRMDVEFDYMIHPILFDLELNIKSDLYQIEHVYGTPQADESTGTIMKVNTLFPARSENGATKGIILLQLTKRKSNYEGKIEIELKYKDRYGKENSVGRSIQFRDSKSKEYYDDNGIRKSILLTRYVTIIKFLIASQRSSIALPKNDVLSPIYPVTASSWERKSMVLAINKGHCTFLNKFSDYFVKEINLILDPNLEKENKILAILMNKCI